MNPLLPDSVEQSIEDLVGAAQRSAAHLEMRDGYMRSDPSFVAWQAGQRWDPDDRESWWHPWYQVTSDLAGKGVSLRRARIVIHFTGEGESAGVETTTDPDVVALCASAFEAVWRRAVPHGHYRPA